MTKRLIPTLALLGLLFLGSQSALAQSPPCPGVYPDFPTVLWHDGGCTTLQLEITPGVLCDVEVCWCWRDLSTSQHDIIIRSFRVTDPDPGCQPSGAAYTVNQVSLIMGLAADALMESNPRPDVPCPPCGQGVDQQFRVISVQCYTIIEADGPDYYVPCEGQAFCMRSYGVCCMPDGKRIVNKGTVFHTQGDCPRECNQFDCN
jgi:hypothetical protein